MMSLSEVKNRCVKVFQSAGIDLAKYQNIDIAVNARLTRTLGRCCYTRNAGKVTPSKIEFSKLFLETGTKQTIEDVIKHECAHAIACIETGERQGHNNYFKAVCARVGTDNDQCATQAKFEVDDTQVYKYFVYCKKCGKLVGKYHRRGKVIQNLPYYTCKCGGSLELKQNF